MCAGVGVFVEVVVGVGIGKRNYKVNRRIKNDAV